MTTPNPTEPDTLRGALPCPFCEKSVAVLVIASEFFGEDYAGNDESWAVTCNAERPVGPGGCGASSGFARSEAEAIARWNTRAALARPAEAAWQPVAMSDERIDHIADLVVKGMPEGIRGFCKSWGWRQFARAILEDCRGHVRATASAAATVPVMDAAADMLKALRRAQQFIRNGVALGFIRMPDKDTPDSAHETPALIDAAIAKATGATHV